MINPTTLTKRFHRDDKKNHVYKFVGYLFIIHYFKYLRK